MNQIYKNNLPVSERVTEIIKQKGLKQIYIAQQMGISCQDLSYMLNGRKLIKAYDIPKLARALGVDPNTLFSFDTKKGDKNAE